jgi:hypothetical protein
MAAVGVGAATSSIATTVGAVGAVVGASVILATTISPPDLAVAPNMPTPIPPLNPPMLSLVPCPKPGSAIFAGYKASDASDDSQLLMVAMDELPAGLELFLTNSFGFGNLTTESSSAVQNKGGSVKVRRHSYFYRYDYEFRKKSCGVHYFYVMSFLI